jgi:TRAP-type C4-dicarboxylate transport system permease small subunit
MASPFFRMRIYRAFTAAYSRLLSWLLVASVAIIIVPVSLQIFSRYTDLIPSYIWTEEMARFLFVWMVMIGAMVGVRDGTHFEVDVWPRLSPRAAAAVRIVAGLGVLAFALVFVWGGYLFTAFAWKRLSELAELPLWMIHIAWPITGLTWLVFQGEHMVDALRVLFGHGDAAGLEQRA